MKRSSTLFIMIILVLLTIGAAAVSPRLFVLFDESYNLNLSKTLARDGVYATHTADGLRRFDPLVTTGPTLAIPMAAALRVGGATTEVARQAMLAIFVTCLLLACAAASEIVGRSAAAVFLLLFYTTPLVLVFGLSVLGDVPAISLALAGVALLSRSVRTERPGALLLGSGILLGLAILAKDSTLLLLPAIVLTCGVDALRCSFRPARLVANLTPVIVAGLIVAGWRGYQVAAMWLTSTAQELADWQRLTAQAAQALGRGVVFAPLSHVAIAVRTSSDYFGPLLLSLGLGIAGYVLVRRVARPDATPSPWANLGGRVAVMAASVWFSWYYVLSGPDAMNRHLLPGIIFAELLIASLAVQVWKAAGANGMPVRQLVQSVREHSLEGSAARPLVLSVLLSLALLWTVGHGVGFVRLYLNSSERRLAMQQTAAAWIEQNTPGDAVLSGWGWYVPWATAFMADRLPGQVHTETAALQGLSDWFVLCPEVEWGGGLDDRLRALLARQGTPVVDQRLYPVYRITWRP